MTLTQEIKDIRKTNYPNLDERKAAGRRGALIAAAIKRYKFEQFCDFMKMMEMRGFFKHEHYTFHFINKIANETVGRSFGRKQILERFSKSERTAKDKSYFMQNKHKDERDEMIKKLKDEWEANWRDGVNATITNAVENSR